MRDRQNGSRRIMIWEDLSRAMALSPDLNPGSEAALAATSDVRPVIARESCYLPYQTIKFDICDRTDQSVAFAELLWT